MRIAYFDCFSGISGDMILGAMLDLGLDSKKLTSHLSKLQLSGYQIEVSREQRGPITGTRVNVKVEEAEQPPRSSDQIKKLITKSNLPDPVKKKSLAAVEQLAKVEGNLHQQHPGHVHFHEVGAVDSIVDMVGACIGLHLLDIGQVVASPLPLGRGFVQCQHGLLPLPAPATLALLESVPVYDSGQERELVTPTGAAILSTVATPKEDLIMSRIEKSGLGAGSMNVKGHPNLLRVFLGESRDFLSDECTVIETNIDDMNPQDYEALFENLYTAGALEVFLTPTIHKSDLRLPRSTGRSVS